MGLGFLHYETCDIIQFFPLFKKTRLHDALLVLKDVTLQRVDWLWLDPCLTSIGRKELET